MTKDKRFREAAIHGTIYFFMALGCLIGREYVAAIWYDTLLLFAGLFLGGVCAMVVLIAYWDKRNKEKDNDRDQNNQISDPE